MTKKFLTLSGIIAITVIIGLLGCSSPNGGTSTAGSGKYSGKDVLGNSYSLSVGSDASRAAAKGDRYSMDLKTRDGKTRTAKGTVAGISEDGTLTLQPDGGGAAFTAMVDGNDLNSVAGAGDEIAEIPFTDGSTITPRTFDQINLRATRWENPNEGDPETGLVKGEHWGSGKSVLVRDFPTNVSNLTPGKGSSDRYTITVSGKSDQELKYLNIEVQGLLTEGGQDKWVYLGGARPGKTITANTTFSETINLVVGNQDGVSYNLMDYDEIIMQVTNVMKLEFTDHPDWESNENNGTIPEGIEDGTILATISDFKIALKDKTREEFAGNLNDYTYGYKEDGLSVEYRQAVWSLTAGQIAEAKKQGAKFEFFILDAPEDLEEDAWIGLSFVWQDPDRGIWWEESLITGGPETSPGVYGDWQLGDGVVWDTWRKKIIFDLSKVKNRSLFDAANSLNFVVGYWGRVYDAGEDWKESKTVDELAIAGASIYSLPTNITGNLGNYSFGFKDYKGEVSDQSMIPPNFIGKGMFLNYRQANWHLSETNLEEAKKTGAKLEIVFGVDISNIPVENEFHQAYILFVWQDIGNNKSWPGAGDPGAGNEVIYGWDQNAGKEFEIPGVTYNATAKKLTITLADVVDMYNGVTFANAADVNLVLEVTYGLSGDNKLDTQNINDLDIVSVSIVQ